MKIAFTGKGGVGKTTIAAILIHSLASKGQRVLAVDCDPDSNLAEILGFEDAANITPVSKMKDLIYDRMEIRDKNPNFYKLNPHIEDIPDKFIRVVGNISLLVMGTVESAGGGCVCPESVFLKNLLNRIIIREGENIVLDMEAGIEHLGRRTAEVCDYFIVVVEPSWRSIETALRIEKLARGHGVKDIYAVANKVKFKEDKDYITQKLGNIKLIAAVPFSADILSLDRSGSVGQLKDAGMKDIMECLMSLK